MEFIRETILHRATSTNIGTCSSNIVNNREELRLAEEEDIPVHSVDADESDVNIVPITCISIASKRYARKCESEKGLSPTVRKNSRIHQSREKQELTERLILKF